MPGIPVHVFRRRDDAGDLRPGEYRPLRRDGGYGSMAHCILCCPTCRFLTLTVRSSFSVSLEGAVEPPMRCPNNCGFHGALVLADWVPEGQGSA